MTERSASIDELLGPRRDVPEPADRQRRRSGLFWLLRTALAVVGLTAVTVAALSVLGVGLPVPVIFAAFLTLSTLRRLVGGVAPPSPRPVALPRDPAFDDGTYRWGSGDPLAEGVARWERKLAWSKGEPKRFAKSVHPALAELVDERLRLRHGVTRAADPDRARALLGDLLWTFLARPPKRTPAPRDLAVLLAEVEKL